MILGSILGGIPIRIFLLLFYRLWHGMGEIGSIYSINIKNKQNNCNSYIKAELIYFKKTFTLQDTLVGVSNYTNKGNTETLNMICIFFLLNSLFFLA